MSADLYDRVHAVMVNWLLMHLQKQKEVEKAKGINIYPECAYSFFGHRGSVDVLVSIDRYPLGTAVGYPPCRALEIYEIWTRVSRLEEALRTFNEKCEFVPKYWLQSRAPGTKLGYQGNHFLLLSSRENAELIKNHWHVFQSAFPDDQPQAGPDREYGWWTERHLSLADPSIPLHEVNASTDGEEFYYLPTDEVNSSFNGWGATLDEWIYLDARDFWARYQKPR